MDTIGASCLSLCQPDEKLNGGNEEKDVLFNKCPRKSISQYESKSFKSILPQIIATIFAASFHIGNGISLAYSAILIAQLEEPDSDIKTSTDMNSWMASVLIIVVPFASVVGGPLMDGIGRLNTIKVAGIPGVLGWSLIAMSKNMSMIIIGRILVGISSAWGTSPAIVYITEIATANLRMSLMAIAPAFVSLGMVITYTGGWYLHWRLLAWICNLFIVIPCLLCFLIPESPAWLILKEKSELAQKALDWIYKYQPKPIIYQGKTFAELQFEILQEEQEQKKLEAAKKGNKGAKAIAKEFLKPTGYKPIVILSGLFIFQQFSGIYITMFYSISFIREAGSSLDAYLASILISIVRLVMSVGSIYILKKYRKRSLMFISCIVMALSMFIAGLYTMWIKEGTTTVKWVPAVALLVYVFASAVGMLPIPYMMIAELFPLEIRGIGYSISYSFFCMFMFAALQSYFRLNAFLGGATNTQWFFAIVSLGALVYTYIFLPETSGMKLTDISNYFKERWVYLGQSDSKKADHEKVSKACDSDS